MPNVNNHNNYHFVSCIYLIKFDSMNLLRAPFGIFYIYIIVIYKITHTLLKKALKSVFILLGNFLNLKKKSKKKNLVTVNSF